jgi:putative flippase GtrA
MAFIAGPRARGDTDYDTGLSVTGGRPPTYRGRTRARLLSDAARPLRFVFTGGSSAIVQLVLLALLTRHGWDELLANVVAFAVGAQVNFALGYTFTWRGRFGRRALWRRWLLFHGSIAGTGLLNILIFAAARHVLPALVASALGIGVASIGNFIVGDRLVFRGRATLVTDEAIAESESAA